MIDFIKQLEKFKEKQTRDEYISNVGTKYGLMQ